MTRTRSEKLAGGTWVAAGMMAMNIAVYGFNILGACLLVPAEFGAMTALLGVFLVGSVVSIGLQTTVARRIAVARDTRAVDIVTSDALRITVGTACAVALVVIVGSVAIAPALRLDSVMPVMLCGAALLPYTIMGALLGLAQGASRWRELALLYLVIGAARVVCGAVAMVTDASVTAAMIGLAAGSIVPVVVGVWLLKPHLRVPGSGSVRPMVRELFGGSHALLAYFVLSSMDAIVARVLFDAHDSGLYASGLIIAKAALFFPQFVSVVLFPDLARSSHRGARSKAVALVGTFGVLAVAATAALPGVALVLVGGDKYAEIRGDLWLFAVAGSVLAVVQLLVFDALARHAHGVVVMIWGAVALVAGIAYGLDVEITGLVTTVACVALALAAAVWFVPTPAKDSRRASDPRRARSLRRPPRRPAER